jgi:hypothetical protein
MADIISEYFFKEKIFNWGDSSLVKAENTRKKYIEAIKTADNGNISPLLNFTQGNLE